MPLLDLRAGHRESDRTTTRVIGGASLTRKGGYLAEEAAPVWVGPSSTGGDRPCTALTQMSAPARRQGAAAARSRRLQRLKPPRSRRGARTRSPPSRAARPPLGPLAAAVRVALAPTRVGHRPVSCAGASWPSSVSDSQTWPWDGAAGAVVAALLDQACSGRAHLRHPPPRHPQVVIVVALGSD
jgi:hypothetical protein